MLASCQTPVERDGPPRFPKSVAHIPNATPKQEPLAKRGNPPHYEVFGKRYHTLLSRAGYKETGLASWYGTKFHGKTTSSGEPYDLYGMTAAHRTLPLPTYAKVTNLMNGKHVIVKINDRGPFHDDRLIDLSYAAAQKLAIYGTGTGWVEVEAIHPDKPLSPQATLPLERGLYLQLGAFQLRQNAQKLAQRVQSYGNVVVRTQGPPFKVQLGPLNKKQAEQLKEELSRQFGLNPLIVGYQ
jgi:rare lipoprotein A